MKQLFMVFGGFFVLLLVLVFIVGGVVLATMNHEVGLRNQFNAQLKVNESEFDKVWKVIKQQANVSEKERQSFKEAYSEIMTSTKGVAGDGKLASFFTQSKIDISPDLFKQLMVTIESQRESFNQAQIKLIKIKEQHDNVLKKFPGSLIVGGRPELEVKLVTSEKTQEAFSTGLDNDTKLFE